MHQNAPRIIPHHIRDLLPEVVDRWQTPQDLIPLPYVTLHQYCDGGLAREELVYLGARPGMGKSVLAIECARSAVAAGHPTLIVTREMSTLTLAARALLQQAKQGMVGRKAGRVAQADIDRLAPSIHQLSQQPLYLTAEIATPKQLDACLQHQEQPFHFVVVDYLQLMTPTDRQKDKRAEVESISKALMDLKQRHQVAILALSSSNRSQPGKPDLGTLRESGELEHDADMVWLLQQDEQTKHYQCVIKKNRSGRTGLVELEFHPEYLSFEEWREPA